MLLLILLLGIILLRTVPLGAGDKVESRVFCAYDRLFIEFEDGRYKWGTMVLDDDGRPMACKRYLNEDLGKLKGLYGT